MQRQHGMSLVEVLVVLALLGLAIGMGSLYLRPYEAPLEAGTSILEGSLRAARLKAMASTSAYRVRPDGAGALVAETGARCSTGTWTTDAGLAFDLPRDVTMTSTAWSVCFGARGVADGNVTVVLAHPEAGSRAVEVLLGGATRVLP